MALTVQNHRVLYNANGSQTIFAIPQSFFSDNDNIVVLVRDPAPIPPTETPQVEGVDYSISGTNVVFGSAPASGLVVGIFREMDIEQVLDLIAGGAFNVESLEDQLDKMVAVMQQLNGMIARAVKVQKTSPSLNIEFPEPAANSVPRWNAGATALENADGSTLGGGSSSPTEVIGEAPSGTIDGLNQDFVLANTPAAGTLKVFVDGLRTVGFTLAGDTITLDDAPHPFGDVICDYEY